MIDVIINAKKSQGKSVNRKYFKPESFRPTREVSKYLEGMYDKSEFINKAISFYILLIQRPAAVMKELKGQRPKLYRQIGRKKF